MSRSRGALLMLVTLAFAIAPAGCSDSVRLGSYGAGAGAGIADASADDADASAVIVPVACTGSQRDCNGVAADGCETDISSSPTNCGSCGKSCLGGPCNLGRCQPAALASGMTGAEWIAVGPTYVTWTTSGRSGTPGDGNEHLVSAKDGTGRIVVRGEAGVFHGVVADGAAIFTARFVPNPPSVTLIQRASPTGPLSPHVAGIFLHAYGIAFDATDLFVAATTSVVRTPRTAQAASPTVLATGLTAAIALSSDGPALYVADPGAGRVVRIEKATGAATWSAPVGGAVSDVTFDTTHVYFAAADRTGRLDKNGGGLELFANNLPAGKGIAVDGDAIYFTTGPALMRADIANPGAQTTLASGFTDLGRIAIDADAIYFTDSGAGIVYRLAK